MWSTKSNEAKIGVFFWKTLLLSPWSNKCHNLISSSAFPKPSLYIWKFSVHILQTPYLKDFEHNLSSMWNKHNCTIVRTFFGIALLWNCNENCSFPVLWPFPSFPNLLTYWVQHFNSVIFRIFKLLSWNFVISTSFVRRNASKAHLTSHSRMSSSRWATAPLWFLESLRPFLYYPSVFCVFLPIALLIFSASVESYHFCPLLCSSFHLTC